MGFILNILSIDWDYFIDATYQERFFCFPDSGNEYMSDSLKDIIWSTKYEGVKQLPDVKIDVPAVKLIKGVLEQSCAPFCQVTDSHSVGYDFVKEAMGGFAELNPKGINLVNVDFHHDLYTVKDNNEKHQELNLLWHGNKDVNCGNWLRHVISEYNNEYSSFTWIKREDSDAVGVEEYPIKVTTDLSMIRETRWDAIFICKSGMWSPPHLDKKFKVMCKGLIDRFPSWDGDAIFENRYDRLVEVIEEGRKQRREFEKKMQRVVDVVL